MAAAGHAEASWPKCESCDFSADRGFGCGRHLLCHCCHKVVAQTCTKLGMPPVCPFVGCPLALQATKDFKESLLGRLEPMAEDEAAFPLSLFHRTLKEGRVKRVFRVVNKPLEAVYAQCKARLASSGDFVELYVYHGTSIQASGSIIKNGFNPGFSGKANGQAFGPGVYVATTARFSDGYSTQNVKGGKRMFICTALDSVAGGRASCKKTEDIYVFPRENHLLPLWVVDYT